MYIYLAKNKKDISLGGHNSFPRGLHNRDICKEITSKLRPLPSRIGKIEKRLILGYNLMLYPLWVKVLTHMLSCPTLKKKRHKD